MGSYLHGLKTQMARLMMGVTIEQGRNPKGKTAEYYQRYLGELMFQSAYVTNLYHQLKKYDLDTACRAFSFSEVKLEKEDLLKRLQLAATHGEEEGLLIQLSEGIANAMVENVLQDVVMGTSRVIKNMVIQRAITGGISALKSSLNPGVLRGVVIGAAKGVVVGFVVDQLKSGTIPPWTTWMEMVQKDPELLLNPEWMRAAGHPTQWPWQVHQQAHRNQPERMKGLAKHLYKHSETQFQSRIYYLSKREEQEQQEAQRRKFPTAPAESTAVKLPLNRELDFPYWARKTK